MTARLILTMRLFNYLCIAMLTVTLSVSGLKAMWEGYVIFHYSHSRVINSDLAQQAETIKRMVPPNAAVFYLSHEREYWNSRLWQRVLYPRPVFLILGEDEMQEANFKHLKEKYQVRYAVSAGATPLDPGFAWQTILYPAPNKTDSIVFGELKP